MGIAFCPSATHFQEALLAAAAPMQQRRASSDLSQTLAYLFRKGLSVKNSTARVRARTRWGEGGAPSEDRHGLRKVGRVPLRITFFLFCWRCMFRRKQRRPLSSYEPTLLASPISSGGDAENRACAPGMMGCEGVERRKNEVDMDMEKQRINWDMLNLCIGSVFEIMENKKIFSTADVAHMLQTRGVDVTDWPEYGEFRMGAEQVGKKH